MSLMVSLHAGRMVCKHCAEGVGMDMYCSACQVQTCHKRVEASTEKGVIFSEGKYCCDSCGHVRVVTIKFPSLEGR